MALEIKKQERETSQSLIRRFGKAVKESGILVRARRTRFKLRKKSPEAKKKGALRREQARKEYERIKKLGLKEER
ncbi:MAG: hypothetical protein WC514_03105 [Candidatus Paceibacterota bacterium]